MNHYYRIGAEVDTRAPVDPYKDVALTPINTIAIDRARTTGQELAQVYVTQANHKRYIGYGALNPAPDIAIEDQTLVKHSDDQKEMEDWIATASSDPLYIWAGYFDTQTGHLVRESVGKVINVTPDSGSHGAAIGLGLVTAIGILALAAKH